MIRTKVFQLEEGLRFTVAELSKCNVSYLSYFLFLVTFIVSLLLFGTVDFQWDANFAVWRCGYWVHAVLFSLQFPMGPGSDGPLGAMAGMEPHHINGSLGNTTYDNTVTNTMQTYFF